MESLSPKAIVAELDKHIVGQEVAKKAVAIALANRERRKRVAPEMRAEVFPKNILMIGCTGVGKTEMARRLANMVDAPFLKVEATRFTEVGYVGRDAESIVHDLVEVSISKVYHEELAQIQTEAEGLATERIISYLSSNSATGGRSRPLGRSKWPLPLCPSGPREHPPALPVPSGEQSIVAEWPGSFRTTNWRSRS